jgi:uncharacterized protein (DUF2267 family)
MKLTGVDVFDATIDRTTAWLQDLMRELNWSDRRKSYLALRFVLHELRDHIPVDRAVQFGNGLPMLVRGFYFEDWEIADKPLPWQNAQGILAPDVEGVVRAVFRVLEKKATDGELEDLYPLLPVALRDLWPSEARAA